MASSASAIVHLLTCGERVTPDYLTRSPRGRGELFSRISGPTQESARNLVDRGARISSAHLDATRRPIRSKARPRVMDNGCGRLGETSTRKYESRLNRPPRKPEPAHPASPHPARQTGLHEPAATLPARERSILCTASARGPRHPRLVAINLDRPGARADDPPRYGRARTPPTRRPVLDMSAEALHLGARENTRARFRIPCRQLFNRARLIARPVVAETTTAQDRPLLTPTRLSPGQTACSRTEHLRAHVRAFAARRDGIGDFPASSPGSTTARLGVTGCGCSVYPSPLRDDG